METFTCNCTACNGLTFTAPTGYITGTTKQVRDMVHTYAQATHARGGIYKAMADRADLVAV